MSESHNFMFVAVFWGVSMVHVVCLPFQLAGMTRRDEKEKTQIR